MGTAGRGLQGQRPVFCEFPACFEALVTSKPVSLNHLITGMSICPDLPAFLKTRSLRESNATGGRGTTLVREILCQRKRGDNDGECSS